MNSIGPFKLGGEVDDTIIRYKGILQQLQKTVEKELKSAPPGYLKIKQNGNRTWFLHRPSPPDKKEIYLNKGSRALIQALAQKRYNLLLKDVIEKELDTVTKVLSHPQGLLHFDKLISVYDDLPEVWKGFVRPHVLPDEMYVEEWLKKYREGASGEDFRSKSEWLVRDILEKFKRPYVYEPKLYLKGHGLVRPDFVILNVRTRQTFYMEHFGMMDNPEYCKKALAKLEAYHRNGFYEGVNLIITMESGEHPMNPEEVEAIIKQHLL